MSNKEDVVSVRLPRELLRRALKLIPRLKADDAFNPFGLRASRSAVLRAALVRGLAALEEQYGMRRSPRQGGRQPASLHAVFSDAPQSPSVSVTDISVGGAFLHTGRDLSVGSEVSIGLALPDGKPPLHLRGKVRHVVTGKGQGTSHAEAGVGIQFVDRDDRSRDRVHRYLDSLAASRHGRR
jgi:Tfp pilus assembly protein PilZ